MATHWVLDHPTQLCEALKYHLKAPLGLCSSFNLCVCAMLGFSYAMSVEATTSWCWSSPSTMSHARSRFLCRVYQFRCVESFQIACFCLTSCPGELEVCCLLSFYIPSWDSNSGPHACFVSTLPMESCPRPSCFPSERLGQLGMLYSLS